jgi:hypothetical protein
MLRPILRFLTLCVVALHAFAAGAANLTPLSWTSAGVGIPSGSYTSTPGEGGTPPAAPLTAPVTVSSVASTCVRITPPIGPSSILCAAQPVNVATFATGAIVIDRSEFHFQGTLASVFAGNQWTVQLLDPVLNILNPAIPGVPSDLEGKTIAVQVVVDAFPTAVFTVPDLTSAPAEAVAFRKIPSALASPGQLALIEARSSALGASLAPFSPGFIETFLDGDAIRLFSRVTIKASFLVTLFGQQVLGSQYKYEDPCGSQTSLTSLPTSNCNIGLEIFTPTTSGAEASLACRADLNHDSVVNAQDLASLKSVFFQRCQQ